MAIWKLNFLRVERKKQTSFARQKNVDAVYSRGVAISRNMIDTLEMCRIIALGSVGAEYVDIDAATERGIVVTNCPDTFIEEVADHTMMLLLAVHRRALEQDHLVRSGRWSDGRAQLLKVPRLMGQTLGLVGFGRVARAVAARAQSFGLRVVAYDPFVDETSLTRIGVEPMALGSLLSASDIVSLHLPENQQTIGLFNRNNFEIMKRGAIFINTGRGSTVVEGALVAALDSGRISGAGLDVFENEPVDVQSPLLGFSNVILSPHNASASDRFEPARKRRVGNEIALVFRGMWPTACVNPHVVPAIELQRWR